jgi:hypothetical protein
MAEQDHTIRALAGLIRAAIFGNSSTTSDAEAVVSSLGIGPDDPVSVDAIEAALRTALAPAPATDSPSPARTPITVTRRHPSFRGGRVEDWQAVSCDGIWRYDRLEIAGTPWMAVYLPTATEGDWYGTLAAARAATADGSALLFVESIQAHERGEHDAQRDPACVRC